MCRRDRFCTTLHDEHGLPFRFYEVVCGLKTTAPPLVLVPKQLWKVKGGYVRVGDLGKSLVQYRLSPTPQYRGQKVHITAIERLKGYLTENDALLVQTEETSSRDVG